MSHNHAHHDHAHLKDLKGRNLVLAISFNVVITAAQVVGGFLSGSLALLSDAVHNFSDVISLIISYIATRLIKKDASHHRTFGYKRAEIIAAFVNAASLLVVAVLLAKEAVVRLMNPQPIDSNLVIWLALLGIVVNGLSVLILKKDSKDNMNMRSAYLHLFTDMLASLAVLIGGIVMKFYQIYWLDSVLTIGISIYLLVVGYDLLKSSFKVLMLFTPEDIEIEKIVACVKEIEEVENMHHIHIWQLNEDEVHLEAHIDFTEDIALSTFDHILEKIEKIAQDFGINHINIQPEFEKSDNKAVIVQD